MEFTIRFSFPEGDLEEISVPDNSRIIDVRREIFLRRPVYPTFVLQQFGRHLPDYSLIASSWVNVSKPLQVIFVRLPPTDLGLLRLWDITRSKTLCLNVYLDETVRDIKELLHAKFNIEIDGLLISDNAQVFFPDHLPMWNIDLSKSYLLTHTHTHYRPIVPSPIPLTSDLMVLTAEDVHHIKQLDPDPPVPLEASSARKPRRSARRLPSQPPDYQEMLDLLISKGFSARKAEDALKRSGFSLDDAIQLLTQKPRPLKWHIRIEMENLPVRIHFLP
jgi:hypothetical protein